MILYLCDAYFPLMLLSFVEFGDTNLMICCGGQASPGSVQGLNKCIKSLSLRFWVGDAKDNKVISVGDSIWFAWFAWNVMEQSLNIYRGYCEILASCIKYVSRYIDIHFRPFCCTLKFEVMFIYEYLTNCWRFNFHWSFLPSK